MTKVTWYEVRCSGTTYVANCHTREEARREAEQLQKEFPSSKVYIDEHETFVS